MGLFSFVGSVYCWLGMFFFLARLSQRVFGLWLSGLFSHLLVVSTHSIGQRFLCRAGSEGFGLVIVGWTVVGCFRLHGPCLVESPLYRTPWNEHSYAFCLDRNNT